MIKNYEMQSIGSNFYRPTWWFKKHRKDIFFYLEAIPPNPFPSRHHQNFAIKPTEAYPMDKPEGFSNIHVFYLVDIVHIYIWRIHRTFNLKMPVGLQRKSSNEIKCIKHDKVLMTIQPQIDRVSFFRKGGYQGDWLVHQVEEWLGS